MALPNGSYICISLDEPVICVQCGVSDGDIAVANEAIFREGQFMGLEGTVRFTECGHFVVGASADPMSVAYTLNQMDEEDAEEEQ